MGRTLISNSAIAAAGTLISALLSGAYVFLGARWLGPADYGSVAATIALAYVLFLTLEPLETGLTLHVAALLGREQRDGVRTFAVQTLRGMLLIASVVLCVWLVAAPFIAEQTGYSAPATLQWLGVFFCASLAMCVPRSMLWGRERFRALSSNLALESATRIVLGLSLISLIGGPAAMVAGYALGMAVALAHGMFIMASGLPPASQPYAKARLSWVDATQPLRVLSMPLVGANVYTALALNAHMITAKRFLDPTEAGLYAGSGSVARLILMGASPVMSVLFARLATLSAGGGETRRLMRQVAALGLGALSLSLVVPAVWGDLVLRLALGQAYSEAGEILLYQWAAVCVITAQSFFAHFLLATTAVRGAWLFVVPCGLLLLALRLSHDTSLQIAQATLVACAIPGSLTYFVLWRMNPGTDTSRHARQGSR